MRLLGQHPGARGAVVVFVLAVILRLVFWHELRDTALDRLHEWQETDMATYVEQARRIADEDWFATEPYHPYHAWQKVAPPEQWLRWYGPHIFHQAPGYSYALAALGRVVAQPLPLLKLAQILLGGVTAAFVLLLARRVGGGTAGIAAELIAAAYGPLAYLETQVLREGPALCALVGILWLLARWGADAAWRKLALLGALLGAFALLHEMASVLTAAVLVVTVAQRWACGWRVFAKGLVAIAGGWVVGFAPLAVRNVAVGAPLLSVSCRATVNFVEANVADALEGGAVFAPPSPAAIAILDAAEGSSARALAGVWRSYDGDLGRMLGNWWSRFCAVWHAWEEADNLSYYFFRNMTRSLTLAPDFRWLFPAGFAGAIALLLAARTRRRLDAMSAPGRADSHARLVLLTYLLAVTAALSLVHPVARFRLYVLPFFMVTAGVLVAMLLDAIRRRAWRRVGALGLLVALGVLLQRGATREGAFSTPRPVDYSIARQFAAQGDEVDLLAKIAEDAAVHDPRNPSYYAVLGQHLERRGDHDRAIACYRRALQCAPVEAIQKDLDALLARTGRR